MPEERYMYNYDKKVKDQKWSRVMLPPNLRQMPWQAQKEIIDEMWHRRLNGEWWLIKGHPVYLTGTAFLFFDFWPIGSNKLPTFKMVHVWKFQVLKHEELDLNSMGIMEVKPRRLGSTEESLCWGWDMVTRYRDSNFGIMSEKDIKAEQAFARLVFSNKNMVWFFKPKNTGSEAPTAELKYEYPPRRIGSANLLATYEDRTPALNSKIWFEATVQGAFDSVKLRAALFDEIGKIPRARMDVLKQWGIMRECLTLNVGADIIGKCVLPSTIEDLEEGKRREETNLDVLELFWDLSNPNNLSAIGRTASGVKRMFRPYWMAADVDEYGFPKAEEAKRVRDAHIRSLESRGLDADVSDYKRKYPETVEESLAQPSEEATLPIALIDRQLSFLRDMEINNPSYRFRAIPGSFEWESGFGGKVRWIPHEGGNIHISRHPTIPNNQIIAEDGRLAPGNIREFGMGVDPIDSIKPRTGGSDGAFTVGVVENKSIDSHCVFDEFDVLIEGDMLTDACACDCAFRPKRPEEFYEVALMAAIYFGCQMLVEVDKPGLVNWCVEHGFYHYVAAKPMMADASWMNRRAASTQLGTKATTATIGNYYGHLRSHVPRRYRNYTHPRLLKCLRKLTADNRGDRDLSVSWGWCRTLLHGIAYKKKRGAAAEVRGKIRANPFTLYQ